MESKANEKKKREEVISVEEGQLKTPHHIPVDVYIQEANDLYLWVQEDMEMLSAAGLSMDLVEDLPGRCESLIKAEVLWHNLRRGKSDNTLEWDNRYPPAYDLRRRLLADCRFAFRKHPHLLAAVRAISQKGSHSKMIQDLNDLSVLGKANPRLLEVIKFDLSLLDKAAQTSSEMAVLLAEVEKDREKRSEVKKIRDQAYTHLKEAVDQIRETGRYVFHQDKERLIGYRSKYIHHLKRKQRRKTTKKTTK